MATTDYPHFCYQGKHPECDAEAARLAALETRPHPCNVCGFEAPTTEAENLHWTLAVEADELHGGGAHLDAEAKHADRQIGEQAFTAGGAR